MRMLLLGWVPLMLAAQTPAVRNTTFENRPALLVGNDAIEVTVFPQGGAIVAVRLRDDPEKTNPLWEPIRYAREAGRALKGGAIGHFVCVDGFGPVSPEERDAGMPGHGEAHTLPWDTRLSARDGKTLTLTQSVKLPLVQEVLTRTLRLVDGETVVSVQSELENLLPFDRPVEWAEHATIGAPFLEPGVTVVEMSARQARTRGDEGPNSPVPLRLARGKDFTWPMAPLANGKKADMRVAPKALNQMGHTTCKMDPSRKLVFVTAFHPGKRLLLGYLFRREDFPWVQSWDYYPADGRIARGLEFSTQPFDVPRREAIGIGRMFDAPTYRWLPAKAKIEARYLMFYTRTPEGFRKVDDVRLEGAALVIEDRKAKSRITLAASRGL